ncbi:MAG: ferrous iron transport protein A [Oscillospiraceae bacterium]|nr:ferrous iron transport protein A [Oscillospiraceae bacterium]
MNIKNLYEIEKKGVYQIVLIPEIELLCNLGLRAGTTVTIQNRYTFGGPVLLRVEDTYIVAVGKDIAKEIQAVNIREGGAL